jgi:hypothetical protein
VPDVAASSAVAMVGKLRVAAKMAANSAGRNFFISLLLTKS